MPKKKCKDLWENVVKNVVREIVVKKSTRSLK